MRARGAPDRTAPSRAAGCVPPRPSHRRAAATTSTHPHPQDPLTVARRPRPARTRTTPCPAAAPDDLPLAPAH
eukprot:3677346-Prymnesium_polylepis.1